MIEFRPGPAIAAVLLAAWIGATPAPAQTEPVAPPTAPGTPADTDPLPPEEASAVEIAARVDTAEARLREIRSSGGPDAEIDTIAELLEGVSDSLQILEQDLDDRILAGMNMRGLTDLKAGWIRERDRLRGWGGPVQDRSKKLADQQLELRRMIEALQAAPTSQESDLPAPLVEKIESLSADAIEVKQLIDAGLEAILRLSERVTEMKNRCSESLERIDQSQQQARHRLFFQDQPPLWRIFGQQEKQDPKPDAFAGFRKDVSTLLGFARQNREQLLFQFVLFVLLVGLIVYLNRRSRAVEQAEDDESLKAAALVLSRPVAAALLLIIFLTRYISPHAPSAVLELNRLLFVIPLLRFVPPLVPGMRRELYALFALYSVHQIWGVGAGESVFQRLLLLVVTGFALAGLIWSARSTEWRRGSSSGDDPGGWRRAGALLARIGALVLFASLTANVLGRVRLAALLTDTTLLAAYAVVSMYALVRLFDSLGTMLLRTPMFLALNLVRDHAARLKQRIGKIVRVAAVVVGVGLVLRITDTLAPTMNAFDLVLDRPWSIGAFQFSLGDILTFAVTVWITVHVARFVRFVLEQDVLPRLGLPRGVPQTVSMLTYYVLVGSGCLIAFSAVGIELSRLTLLIGALGVGIGFGLQNLVNNFVSGMILIFERPIKIGDTVEVGTVAGDVRRIGIRSSIIRTFGGSDVIVPNGSLISREVVNWTLTDRLRRIEIPVGVAYDSNPAEVLQILTEIPRGHESALATPEPHTLIHGFGKNALELELRFWTTSPRWLHIKTEVIVAIHEALGQAGIEIAFPQLDLHVRSDETEEGATGAGEEPAGAAP